MMSSTVLLQRHQTVMPKGSLSVTMRHQGTYNMSVFDAVRSIIV